MQPGEPQFRPSEAESQDLVVRLTQEKRELQEYAERVTRELRRYQQARPVPPARAEDDVPLPPWAMNMQMMSPLLFSYEERIAELEAVIERSTSLAEQAQVLAKENDSLRAELQERTEQLRRSQLVPAPRDGASGAIEHQEELQELYRLSVEQNEALAQQNQLLKVQIDRMQQSLAAGQQQAKDLQARALEGSKAFSSEKEKAEALAQQRSVVEKRLETVNGELVEDIKAREQLQRDYEGLQHEFQLQKQSLETCKRNLEERCSLAQIEEERLKVDLERSTKNDKEQRQRISSLEIDLAKVTEQHTMKKREAEATKQEAEQCVREMDSVVRKLTDISEKHDELRRRLSEQDAKVAELLLEKERWSHNEANAQRSSERLQLRLQSEVATLRQQRDVEVETLRSQHGHDKDVREEKIRKSEQEVCQLEMKVELLDKQRSWESAASENQNSLYNAERSRLQADIEEAHQARLRLERQVGAARSEASKAKGEMEALAAESHAKSSQIQSELADFKAKALLTERSLSQTREELQMSELRAGYAGSDHSRVKSELQEERLRGNSEVERERRKALSERRALERQIQATFAKAHQGEQRAMDLLRAQEMLEQQWKAEFALEKGALEGEKERLSSENRVLREKSRRLLKVLAVRRLSASSELHGCEDLAKIDDFPLAW